jgi:hypothetical protein
MTGDADTHDADGAGEQAPADPGDIDEVMAEFTRRMESLRLDLDRISQNLDTIGR